MAVQHYAVYIMIWFQHGRHLESTKLCGKHHTHSVSLKIRVGLTKNFELYA
jgi:hypothetical protein